MRKRSTPSYVLLEGFNAHAKTIQRYQKGKHVMAEPGFLDLRSDLEFGAGSREKVLAALGRGPAEERREHPLRRRGAQGHRQQGCLHLQLANGETCRRRTSCSPSAWKAIHASSARPAKTWSACQYQLDDPKEFRDETILVVGAGDSAIENALALAEQNDVWIINRGKEFSRAKDANLNAVVAAITDPAAPSELLLRDQHQERRRRMRPVRRR